MQRDPDQGSNNKRLKQSSPRRPAMRRGFFIAANPDRDASDEQQCPYAAPNPAPLQHSLQIVFVQESPRPRSGFIRHVVVRGKDNPKGSRPEPEKSNVAQRAYGDARRLPTGVASNPFSHRIPAVDWLLHMRPLSKPQP